MEKILVKAKKLGYFDNKRVQAGSKFLISADEFSPLWMAKVEMKPQMVESEVEEAPKKKKKKEAAEE